MKRNNKDHISLKVIKGNVLGVNVYRGFARLCDLAIISKADIYDQINNPNGTQRDLSPKHAKAAYEYVKARDFAFWPEVFLCTRDKKVTTFIPSKIDNSYGTLIIDLSIVKNKNKISISRIDGNHRLHYSDGKVEGFVPIQKTVSFCLVYNLTREEEIILFKDINDNQKAMNTSHLDNIQVKLTPEEILKRKSPDLYISQKLGRDSNSSLFGRVYEGGRKSSGIDIPLRSLRTGIMYMLSRSSQLQLLPDVDVQYKLIMNYFNAVKKWQTKAWTSTRDYIILRGAGLWTMCFIGAFVIDKVLSSNKFKSQEMLKILKSGKEWDWTNKGDFRGYSGRAGALEISKMVINQFSDKNRITSKELYKRILEEP